MRRALILSLCVAMLSLAFGIRFTQATTRIWGGGAGSWSNGGLWVPVGVPAAGDTVSINISSGKRTVTCDYTVVPIALAALTDDQSHGGPDGLSVPAHHEQS